MTDFFLVEFCKKNYYYYFVKVLNKLKETAASVFPVMVIVLFLGLTIVPLDKILLARLVIGGILLILALTIFLVGVDLGIQPM